MTSAIGTATPHAPHETAGILRIHRSGVKGPELRKLFKVGPVALVNAMSKAIDAENEAYAEGRAIHDVKIPRNYR
jgi:hypothetical protein